MLQVLYSLFFESKIKAGSPTFCPRSINKQPSSCVRFTQSARFPRRPCIPPMLEAECLCSYMKNYS